VVKVKEVKIDMNDILEETKNMSKDSRHFLLSLVRKEAHRKDREKILIYLKNPDYSCFLEALVTRILSQVLDGTSDVISDIDKKLKDNLSEEEAPPLTIKGISNFLTELSKELQDAAE
jgi:DNA-binding transcriptional regulator GbsR (MarR family)